MTEDLDNFYLLINISDLYDMSGIIFHWQENPKHRDNIVFTITIRGCEKPNLELEKIY